jgi:hypothetical protein
VPLPFQSVRNLALYIKERMDEYTKRQATSQVPATAMLLSRQDKTREAERRQWPRRCV